GDCGRGLVRCLERAPDDPALRETILRAMFDIYRIDAQLGGVGVGDEIPEAIDMHATADERRTVAGWARATAAGAGDSWHRRTLTQLVIDLEADSLGDEDYLKLCRANGLVGDLVERLLALGRVDEARREAEKVNEHELT